MKNKALYLIAAIVFALTFAILGFYESDLLFTMQSYSYYSSDECFSQIAIEEGGQIALSARYILQFFYNPEVAALILSLILTAAGLVSAKLVKSEGFASICHFIPQSLFVTALAFVNMENISFVTTSIFSAALAYILIILTLALAQKLSKVNVLIGANIVFAASILMVWYAGIYGILPIVCYAIIGFVNKQKNNISLILTAIVIAIFIVNCVANNQRALSPLPDSYFTIPFAIVVMIFVFMIASLVASSFINKKDKCFAIGGAILFCTCSSFALLNSDKNFRTQCSINRDLENYDFKKIIERVDALEAPTEANMAYRVIALDQTDRLSKALFTATPSRSADIDPYRRHLADFCLYSGSSNDALLHAMNNHLRLGYCFSNIKTMAISYLLNGEIESAKKMLTLLSQGIFYKEWTDKVSSTISDPKVFFKKFTQYQKTKRGSYKNVVFINNSENIFEMYERDIPKNPVLFERLLLSKLYQRDIDSFSEWMLRMASLGVTDYKKAMPIYFQEAACLCALKGNANIINNFPVTPQIRQRVQKFAQLKQSGESEQAIADKIGRSYLTYFFFAPTEE